MKKILLGLMAILMLPALAACGTVDTGHRGVLVAYGKPVDQVGEGLNFYNPVTTKLVEIDVRQQPWESQTEAYTKDVQQATIKFKLTYHLNPEKALQVYQTVGTSWAATLIPQVVQQQIKNRVGQARAVEDMINNRQAITSQITEDITNRLRPKDIIVDGFEIQDVSFTQAFEQSVEKKQVAVQDAETAKNKTVQIQEEANQKVIAAKAEAEAMSIKTTALAGSPKLVDYEAVLKWDGHLPQNMYGGNVPFVKTVQ